MRVAELNTGLDELAVFGARVATREYTTIEDAA
jgi:hypothetical protein